MYLRNRYYEPVSGRFTRRDPLSYFQEFTYVGNSPHGFLDPSGLEETAWKETPDPGFSYFDIFILVPSGSEVDLKIEKAMRDLYNLKYNLYSRNCDAYADDLKAYSDELKRISGAEKIENYIRRETTNGHVFLYVKFIFPGGRVKWWFAETNNPSIQINERFAPFTIFK